MTSAQQPLDNITGISAVPERPGRRLFAGGCGPVGDIAESYNREVRPGTAIAATTGEIIGR
jgi:hypothetical protein